MGSQPAPLLTAAVAALDLDNVDAYEHGFALLVPAVGRRIEQFLERIDVTRIFRKEIGSNGGVTLTLFDLWRIERETTGRVGSCRYDLARQHWCDDASLTHWPSLQLLPIQGDVTDGGYQRLRYLWKSLQTHAIREVQRQAMTSVGAFHLPTEWMASDFTSHLKREIDAVYGLEALLGDPDDLVSFKHDEELDLPCWECLRTGGEEYQERGGEECPGCAQREQELRIEAELLANGQGNRTYEHSRKIGRRSHASTRTLKALYKTLWHDVIDRDVLSLASRVVGPRQTLSLSAYLNVARHREAVQRIADERPNLLPLMADINPRQWHRSDLFSRKLWVRGRRQSTVVDCAGFHASRKNRYLHSFDSPGTFMFLTRSPASVVAMFTRHWREGRWSRHYAHRILRLIQAITPSHDRRPFARQLPLLGLFRSGSESGFQHDIDRLHAHCPNDMVPDKRTSHGFPLEFERVLRTWVIDRLTFWRDHGFHALMRSLPNARGALGDIYDWLGQEGIGQLLPDKHMPWAAIRRRSDEWHARINGHAGSSHSPGQDLCWTVPLARIEAKGLKAIALLDSASLREEGNAMHHCVGDGAYDQLCLNGTYHVFAITAADGSPWPRATLGLRFNGQVFVVDQVQGYCRSRVPGTVAAFARHVAKEVSSANCATSSVSSSMGDPA